MAIEVLHGLLSQLVPRHLATRLDGWLNPVTGLGGPYDKVTSTQPTWFQPLRDEALTAMFHSDPTVRKACYKRPTAALRSGIQVSVPGEGGGVKVSTAIQNEFDRLDVMCDQFVRALAGEVSALA